MIATMGYPAWRQGSEPCLAEDELKELLGHNVIPLLRLLYAQAAATCNALARALSCKCPRKQARPQLPASYALPGLHVLRAQHAHVLDAQQQACEICQLFSSLCDSIRSRPATLREICAQACSCDHMW